MVFKMIAARKEADIKYQAFLDNDKVDVNFAKLEYVYKSYISLLDRIESISKLMGERQFLTELHFIGPIFPLNAHEKYHEISDRIQKEVSDFFKDSKIFLNDFTRFYLSEIRQIKSVQFAAQPGDDFLPRLPGQPLCGSFLDNQRLGGYVILPLFSDALGLVQRNNQDTI